ncbi:hypothetical protein [Bradyrhizobium sp.]
MKRYLWIPLCLSMAPLGGCYEADAQNAAYALDNQIAFNVLDQVEYYPQTGKLILAGHYDERYDTRVVPYIQYLATLLEYPSPEFSLNWTPDSNRRVDQLRRRLDSDDEWRKLAREWGRWIDDSDHVTPAGRVFLEMFGMTPPGEGAGDPWQRLDRYQLLSGIFGVTGRTQASAIVAAFGRMYRAMPNITLDDLRAVFAAAGALEVFDQAIASARAGTITAGEAELKTYGALFDSVDQAFNFPGRATRSIFDRSVAQGAVPSVAMQAAFSEFNRQLAPMLQVALTELWRSKPEIQVPLTLVSPSLKDTLIVEPQYIGIDRNSLLAKLMFDVDYMSKTLINAPELADLIPGYQTEYTFKQNHPSSFGRRTSSARMWISVDKVDARRSTDDNILSLRNVAMRINMRQLGPNGRDLPNQQPGDYEKLLTSLYEDFVQNFSPLFHEFREAAKLAYAAQWLKARKPDLQMPAEGRTHWQGPQTVPGIIFVTWSPQPSRSDVVTVSAIGGNSLHVPPSGPPQCVLNCLDFIPKDPAIKPVAMGLIYGEIAISDLSGRYPRTIAKATSRKREECKKMNPLAAKAYVVKRVIELKAALTARLGSDIPNVTMAVAVAKDSQDCDHKIISGNEGSYLRPDVRQLAPPRADETVADGFDHAERNIITAAKSSGLHLTGQPIGATRLICCECQIAVRQVGAIMATLPKVCGK